MNKKLLILLFVGCLTGCSTVTIPKYIKDENPYKQVINADYEKTLDATYQALKDSGWEIISKSDPNVFEHSSRTDPNSKQIVLFSDIQDLPFFLGTRFARVNIYLRSTDQPNQTEVEMRYLTVNSLTFGAFKNYKHPLATERLFNNIKDHVK
ncbi:MAG: hypothetical protein KBD53_01185 [Candidatus Omnitrophica bacterium]|nr:hypothetical protein [Candidatus Omnitrophota bacterium]